MPMRARAKYSEVFRMDQEKKSCNKGGKRGVRKGCRGATFRGKPNVTKRYPVRPREELQLCILVGGRGGVKSTREKRGSHAPLCPVFRFFPCWERTAGVTVAIGASAQIITAYVVTAKSFRMSE